MAKNYYAKYENEGYCPCTCVPTLWNVMTDNRLPGLWSIVGDSIVCERSDENGYLFDSHICNSLFGKDLISYDVLSAIVKRNASADKILIHQPHISSTTQSTSDIQKILNEVTNPELIVHSGSNFLVILSDAEYGLDVWVWDLSCTL